MKKKAIIKHFGTATKLAQALRITPAAVTRWPDKVPFKQAYKLEALTLGAISMGDAYLSEDESERGEHE